MSTSADRILGLKKMLDDGLITKEEFNTLKKKELSYIQQDNSVPQSNTANIPSSKEEFVVIDEIEVEETIPQPLVQPKTNQNYAHQTTQRPTPTRKKKGCGCMTFVYILIGLFVIGLIATNSTSPSESSIESAPQNKILFDVTEYKYASAEKLISKMGEPSEIDHWNYITAYGTKYPVTTYSYELDDHYEFLVHNDQVIRISIYSSKYWSSTGSDIKITNRKKAYQIVGFASYEIGKTKDNNVNIRCECTGSFDGTTIVFFPIEGDAFGLVKITFKNSFL